MWFTSAALGVALLAFPADGTPEWGGFRGNNGLGVADSERLPDALDPAAACSKWRAEIPAGYSSPCVAGDDVYLTATEPKRLITLCIDRRDGATRWSRELEFDGKRVGANSAAAPSPVTDGERVYSLFHSAGLVAYDRNGEELWHNPLGPFNIPHGLSTSPLLCGDRLILAVDQDTDSYLLALDKRTGKELWKVERGGVTHGYSTPAVYSPAEGPVQIIVSSAYQVSAYSVEDGEKLWWVNGSAWQTKAIPLVVGDLCIVNAYMVPSAEFGVPKISETWAEILEERDADEDGFIAKTEWNHPTIQQVFFIFDLDGDSKFDEREFNYLLSSATAVGGMFAIELGGRGDVTDTHVRWRYEGNRGLPDIPSPLVVDGILYMIKEGGILTAVDIEDGAVIKQGRVGEPDSYFASPVAGAGKIITASQSGQLSVIRAGAEWEVLSTTPLEEEVWSTPAIAGGDLFVRSQKALYCFRAASDV